MTRKFDQGKAWPPNRSDALEAEDDIQQQTPTPEKNTQGLGEQMHSSNEATQKCPQDTLHQPQNTNSLRDKGDNTTHMVLEVDGEPAVKFHAKNVKVGLGQMETPDKTKSPRVDSPGSTNH